MSLLLIALLLFLLFGGDRVGAAGRGLGEAARRVKRAFSAVDPNPVVDPKAPAPTMIDSSVSKEPKLLPAKGESSASREVGDA
ncbi:MAG TPA: twin-arginine translocase TatA/TatE family subunit [Polyangiaceae bacterium]|nr:twin-arginine translocase TatA/TatE family subunit [Polyangiaceae bacterium]